MGMNNISPCRHWSAGWSRSWCRGGWRPVCADRTEPSAPTNTPWRSAPRSSCGETHTQHQQWLWRQTLKDFGAVCELLRRQGGSAERRKEEQSETFQMCLIICSYLHVHTGFPHQFPGDFRRRSHRERSARTLICSLLNEFIMMPFALVNYRVLSMAAWESTTE